MEKRLTNRSGCRIETRENGARVLRGYAAVFWVPGDDGTEYRLWDDLTERIAPGAFNRPLQENQDVRGLYNHDVNLLLGRTTSGTMRLSVDTRGLLYEMDLPNTNTAADLAVSVERGDIDGSSFGFIVRAQRYEWGKDGAPNVRTIEDVDLFDVGPVVFPAYTGTSAGIRSAFYRAVNDSGEAEKQLRKEYEEAKANHLFTIQARNKILLSRY